MKLGEGERPSQNHSRQEAEPGLDPGCVLAEWGPGNGGHFSRAPEPVLQGGLPGSVTLEMVASLRPTLANRLVEVLSWSRSPCSSHSRAASWELLVLAVAVSRTSRIISEAEQL